MPDAWPEDLPRQFLRGSTTHGIGDGRLVSQMEVGPDKMRPRSSAVPDALSGTLRMTTAQKTTLRDFVKTTLMGGTLPFTFPDPDGGEDDLLVRFRSLPPAQKSGPDDWRVTLELDVLP